MVDLEELKKRVSERDRVRTHWEGCVLDRRHRDCAIIALIDELEATRLTAVSAVPWKAECKRLMERLAEALEC